MSNPNFRKQTAALVILAALLVLTVTTASAEGPIRPVFAGDIGPFVAVHYLDQTALENYLDKYGMDEFEDQTLGYGLGWRILAGPVLLDSHIEGWGTSTSGNGAEASIWGVSMVGRMGFAIIRRAFLVSVRFGPGLTYSELNIDGGNAGPDFSGWKLGLLGDAALSVEYLFPVGGSKTEGTRMNIPIGVQLGYSGEMISDPWYERSGRLDAVARDRFMGPYVRIGISFGGGQYSSTDKSFDLPNEDMWPIRPPSEQEEPEEPEEEPEEEPAPDDEGDRA
jgi:hypothetical protein